jgi:multisubunit Na+/H+ antiporter MnhE subunit
LLILSANGNLRALLSGLVFAVTVQAAISGLLAPARQWVTSLWMVEGGPDRNLLNLSAEWMGLVVGAAMGAVALWRLRVNRDDNSNTWNWAGAFVGLAIAMGWGMTQLVASVSFEPIAIQSLSFSAPSAEWLMRTLSTATAPNFGFDAGLLPGVFIGSLIASVMCGEFKFEGFQTENKLGHYLTGAVLMGFGAVMAGGCTVGSGMSGGAIFSNTAWLTLVSIVMGAGLTYKALKSINSPI